MTQQEWIEHNTFHCPHLSARITPAQCAANRARKRDVNFYDGTAGAVRPGKCEICTDYEQLMATVGQTKEDEMKGENKVAIGGQIFVRRESNGKRICNDVPMVAVRRSSDKGTIVLAFNKAARAFIKAATHLDVFQAEKGKVLAFEPISVAGAASLPIRHGSEDVVSCTALAREVGLVPGAYRITKTGGYLVVNFEEKAA